jgi:N6-L-threonylcarbamoyladenine synthase
MKSTKDIYILGIETSCDETSASVVKNGRYVLSNVISSQIDLHKAYGGVVPEIASRKHVELINPVIKEAIIQSGMKLEDMDAIAVTSGPGLVGALLVGLAAAKGIAFTLGKPLIGVHHIEGHICANYIEHKELEPPFVCLVASGGHSHIVHVLSYDKYEVLGHTRDDAAGEAFDKVARALGLGYPGGPAIQKAAEKGNPHAVKLPRTYFKDSFDFSFSGLKTAVLNYLNNQRQKGDEIIVADVCASFQQAVVEVLVENTIAAAKMAGCQKVALAGGVAANSSLRKILKEKCFDNNLNVYYPNPILCTDNAAMVSCSGFYKFLSKNVSDLYLNAIPDMKLK